MKAAIHGLRYSKTIEFGLTQASPKKGEAFVPFLEDEDFVANIEAMLSAVITELFDPSVPFTQTEDDRKCGYCDFKLICGR